jgi:hypothetical protein
MCHRGRFTSAARMGIHWGRPALERCRGQWLALSWKCPFADGIQMRQVQKAADGAPRARDLKAQPRLQSCSQAQLLLSLQRSAGIRGVSRLL